MGSQTLEVIRLGLWASLTGGWFYDPHQGLFTNTVHFYLWMFLVLLPFSLYLGTPESSSTFVWLFYSFVIGFFFLFVKFFNHRLHLMFDGEEIPASVVQLEGEEASKNETDDIDENLQSFPQTSQDNVNVETIELQEVHTHAGSSETTSNIEQEVGEDETAMTSTALDVEKTSDIENGMTSNDYT